MKVVLMPVEGAADVGPFLDRMRQVKMEALLR